MKETLDDIFVKFLGFWIFSYGGILGISSGEAGGRFGYVEGRGVTFVAWVITCISLYLLVKRNVGKKVFLCVSLIELGLLCAVCIYLSNIYREEFIPLISIPYIYLVKKTYDFFHREKGVLEF